MQAGPGQLKNLRKRSLRELIVRGRQEAAKLGECVLGLSVGEMSDRTFLHHLKDDQWTNSAEAAALAIANRISACVTSSRHSSPHSFFPSLGYRNEIVAMMERRFGRERDAIIQRANRAIEGRFDLLGFANLSFGEPPDWLLEPIAGIKTQLNHWSRIAYLDPTVAGDKKIIWELSRLQHFVTLGQAYWMTSDETYAEAFVSQATSWMDANPPKRGINWASSLELAFRSIAWLWALHLFAASRQISSGFVLRSLKHLIAHGQHIQLFLSRYFSPNTHLTGEALGLFYLGTALSELRSAETWRRQGLKIMLDQLARQVRDDGVYFEQSTYYHRYTADFYTHLVVLARASNLTLSPEVEERLARILTHLMWITRPDGSSPLIGDDDGGRLILLGPRRLDDFRDTLATGAALFGRGDWKQTAGDAGVETLWLLGPGEVADYDEIQSEVPPASSRVFEASGYSVMRDGWSKDSTYVLMDCGPHGSLSCGHAHSDALSFEFAALGNTWIVDPGTFTYTADPELRDKFRSTESHNTVTVDGESQSTTAGPFSWGQVAQTSLDSFTFGDAFDYVAGSHGGYERLADPVRHTRAIITVKADTQDRPFASLSSYLIVRDSFIGAGRHNYAIRYHLAPGCSGVASGDQVIVTAPDGARATIAVFGQTMARAEVTQGWVSRAYGQREPAPVAVFYAEGWGPQHFTSLIIPEFQDQSITVGHQSVSHPAAAAEGFQIVSDKMCDVLLLSDGREVVNCGSLTAAGAVAWARFENDECTRGFLLRGRLLEATNGFSFSSADQISHCEFRRTERGIEGSVNGGAFNLALGEQTHGTAMNWTNSDLYRQAAGDASADSRRESVPASEGIN